MLVEGKTDCMGRIGPHDAEVVNASRREEKLTFPDIGIVCRGGEGGVKGRDRVAAAKPPLTPPAPRLCSIYRGMSVGFVQWIAGPKQISFS